MISKGNTSLNIVTLSNSVPQSKTFHKDTLLDTTINLIAKQFPLVYNRDYVGSLLHFQFTFLTMRVW
jgi:hypothetical protein